MQTAAYLCWVVFVAALVPFVSSSGINTWTELSSKGSPSQRTGASASLNGDNIIVFGGNAVSKSGSNVFLNDAWAFNLGTNTWSSLTNSAVSARTGHSAVSYKGATVIFGGQKTNITYTNELWQYSNDAWTQITGTGSQPTARANHAAVVAGDSMYIFGGFDGTSYLNDIYVFSLVSKTWTKLSPASSPSPRAGASLVMNDSGNIVLFGGADGTGSNNEVWLFAGSAWTQQPTTGTQPTSRYEHSASRVPGGFVIYGGQTGATSFVGDLWQYTYATSAWTQLPTPTSTPVSRGGQATVAVAGGFVIFGGSLPHGQASDIWKFIAGPVLSQSGAGYKKGRTYAATAQRDASSMWIFGGFDDSNVLLNDLVYYDIKTQTFAVTTPTSSPLARSQAGLAAVSTGVLLIGGKTSSQANNDVWLYQTATNNWVQQTISGTVPAGRYGHSVVADSSNSVYVFGGVSDNGDYLNDVWKFTVGSGWTKITTTNTPSARAQHIAAKTSTGILVFGGMVDDATTAPQDDLWLLDTTTRAWTQVTGAAPSARYGHAVVAVPGGVLVYGGADEADNALGDAWRFDLNAETWSQVTGISASPRKFAVAGASASAVAVFGGADAFGLVDGVDILNIGGSAYVSASGSDISGTGSVAAPFATIAQAASFAPYGTITLQAGTYTGYGNLNVVPSTVAQITASGAVTIDCAGSGSAFVADATTAVLISGVTISHCKPAVAVSGGSVTLSHVTLTGNTGSAASLNGGVLQAVDSTISSNTAALGGGIYASAGTVILLRTTLSSNTATQSGGAVYVGSNVEFIATNTAIQSNNAVTGAGVAAVGSSVALQNVTFISNKATSNGGGIYAIGSTTLSVVSSSATSNSADLGGFLYGESSAITATTVTAKTNSANSGGAFYLSLGSHTISGSTVQSNTAVNNGGGAYFNLAPGTVTSTTFTSNAAQNGAGVYATKSLNTFTSATFTSNTASMDGGAWYAATSNATISTSTFTSNQAQRGAVFFSSQVSGITASGSHFNTNQASLGGAVSFFDVVQPTITTPTYSNNVAPYGNLTATATASLVVESGPSGPQNASAVITPIVINLVDALGQLVASDSTTMIAASVSVAPSTRNVARATTPVLQGTRVQQAINGVVTFSDLVVLADEGTSVAISISTSNLQLQTSIAFMISTCFAGQQDISGSCSDCPPGQYRGADDDAVCQPCPTGSFSSSYGATSCTPCAAGTFAGDPGSTVCAPCQDGWFSYDGASHCSTCEQGKFSNSIVGVDKCTPCAPGYNASSYGTVQCTPCPAGTMAADPGSTECTQCVPGQFSGSPASTSCSPCAAGSYSNYGAPQCILCPVGQYASEPGSPSCSVCGYNRVASTPGATSCTQCPVCAAGYYQTVTGDAFCPTCTRCGPGTFSPVSSSASCSPCPRGSFSSGYGAQSCRACPVGTYSGSPGSVTCTPCPAKSATNIPGSVQCSACPANAYSRNGTTCQSCPSGATCAGNTPLNSLPGYYGGPQTYLQCFAKDNCVGNNQCAKGYSGPLCSVCTDGYGRLGTLCIECLLGYVAGAWVLGVALAIFFIIHMFIAGRDIRLAQLSGQQVHPRATSIRILMNHLQILGWLAILKVRWSGSIQLWFFIFSAIPVMNLSNFALDCTTGLTFYQQFFFFMLLPIITLAGSLIIFVILYYLITGRSSYKLDDMIPHYVTALIFIFRYILPIIMLQIWQTVDCVKLNMGSYIAQDMRNICKSDTNTAAVGIGMVVFIIFVFALPFYAFVQVMMNRKQLRYNSKTNKMAFLWLGFKEHRYFYEFINYAKSCVLIFFVLLLRRYTALQQMYAVVWLFIVVMFLFLWMRPYATKIQNVSEFFALVSQFGSFITGLIYYDQGQQIKATYVNVDGLFIALNTIVILGLLVTIYFVEKMNKHGMPVLTFCNRENKNKSYDDESSEDEKKKKGDKTTDHNNIILRVMDGPPLPPRSPRKGYASHSDSYSDSYSRSSRSSHTRSSRSRSSYTSDEGDEVRRRSRSRSHSGSRSGSPASSRSRTDTEEAENGKKQRRRSLSLDSRSSGDNSSASSEYRRKGGSRQRSASVSSEESHSEESHSDSSEYGRKSRPQGRERSYSSSSASSSDAELRRGDDKSHSSSDEDDEKPLNPSTKGSKDQNYQDMNIGQLINNIEKLLGDEK